MPNRDSGGEREAQEGVATPPHENAYFDLIATAVARSMIDDEIPEDIKTRIVLLDILDTIQ